MSRKAATDLPQTQKILTQMGEQIKLARLRRNLSVEIVAERVAISRAILWNVEKGNPSVAIGIYAAVLHALTTWTRICFSLPKMTSSAENCRTLNCPCANVRPTRRRATDENDICI